jgi:cell division septation protein DedD
MKAAGSISMSKFFLLVFFFAVSPVVASAQSTVQVNPVYRRAQTLVNDGNAAAGRALVDSMISVAAPGSNDYAEGVYWRAVLAATAADAEIDYKRIVIDYPSSPRVEDALIRLSQLEMARGNYDGAVKHLNQIATEHPDSPARGRAGYWLARALFDKNDIQNGCGALTDALAHTAETDTELRNQIDYLNQRCASLPVVTASPSTPPATAPTVAPAPPPADTVTKTQPVTPPPAPVVTRPSPPPATPKETVKETPKETPSSSGERVWSVQVAAYNVKSQADAMVAKLKKSGYEARVDGDAAPFRVRIGKYPTQSQAGAVQRSLKAKKIDGFVVQADIR